MDTLHSVLRAIRGETKPPREHLSVFREFIGHLDRAAKRRAVRQPPPKQTKANGRDGKR